MPNRDDDFDGGNLLALFGFEEEAPSSQRAAQPPEQNLQDAASGHESRQRAGSSPPEPLSQEPAPRGQPAPAAREHPSRRGPVDLRHLEGRELVRAIVLSDVLGPPPGRRGGRGRR